MKQLANRAGIALLTVLVAMMIMSIMLFEFQYAAMIERKLAYNELNQLQAYYLAKSGVHIGLLRIALYGRARRNPAIKNAAGGLDITPYLEMIWNLPLPPFPPDAVDVKKMDKSDRDAAEKELQQTMVEEGKSTHVITSESSKINLNYLVVPSSMQSTDRIQFTDTPKSLFEYVGKMIMNLIDNFLKDSDNPFEEYGNIKPDEIVYNIMDWVNPGNNSYNGGAKDGWYEQQKPPYKAKRNRFYTTDELKLVKGIDDHLFTKLKPYVTVYSYDGKININSAGKEMFRALYRDFTEDDLKKLLEERDRIGGWTTEQSFVDYVSNTLGRSGFKTIYNDANNYPFTIATRSFLIEASGSLTKSKSTITKIIRVGVALTSGKGGVVDPTKTNQNDCTNAGLYWNPTLNQCMSPPTTSDECLNLAGTWTQQGSGQYCCVIRTYGSAQTVCPQNTTPQTAGSTGASGTQQGQQKAVEPNAMRILFWTES